MGKIIKNIHWVIIGFALFNIFTYMKDMDEKIKEVQSKEDVARIALNKAKKTKKEITNFYRDIDEAKNRIEKVAAEIEKTQQLLPSEISDTENVSTLRKMADELHIKETNISPEKDEERGFYIARKYHFGAKATYLQFLIMFEKIAESKRILNVSGLTFKKIEQSQRTKFQLIDGEFTLEAYKYNNSFKEDRGIDKIEKEFKEKSALGVNAAKPAIKKAE